MFCPQQLDVSTMAIRSGEFACFISNFLANFQSFLMHLLVTSFEDLNPLDSSKKCVSLHVHTCRLYIELNSWLDIEDVP